MRLIGELTDPSTGTMYNFDGVIDVIQTSDPGFSTLWGFDCGPGDVTSHAQMFPGARYMADFGQGEGVETTLTPMHMIRPTWARDAGCLVHYSHKTWDPEMVTWWAEQLTEPSFYTYWHEPHCDNVAPQVVADRAQQAIELIDATPTGADNVLFNGPCLTRFWMVQPGNDPDVYWYPGATALFFDAYIDSWIKSGAPGYPSPEWMFQGPVDYARAKGVPWGVRELGGRRKSDDPTGNNRAAWFRDMADWIGEQTDCLGVAYFCRGATGHLDSAIPERNAWAEIVANQGVHTAMR